MSDEPQRPGEAEPQRHAPAGLWEHWCEHPGCGAWGAWGLARGKRTAWYCSEHRPEEWWALES